MKQFAIDPRWGLLLSDLGVDPMAVLRRAGLPLDLMARKRPTLSVAEYYRYWEAVGELSGEIHIPIAMADALRVEMLSTPILACLSSKDMNTALFRLSQYKPLVGPLCLDIDIQATHTQIALKGLPRETPPPAGFLLMELVFLTQVARLATRQPIRPKRVELEVLPTNTAVYEDYFQCPLSKSDRTSLVFDAIDARRPFLTADEVMWELFEAELIQRMSDLSADTSIVDRVRTSLAENLPGGQVSIHEIARSLGMSSRTLQRRLSAEDTNFNNVLRDLRRDLALHYLRHTDNTTADISYLLGYVEPNSFFRAFSEWTGSTPDRVRNGDSPANDQARYA
ncbi:AraC family transcriptional regulator ligand-binding domain-containing protein [Maricaulis sp. D1M11]|uniref:AraC family transcriptional regulator n=1 Tax=Maricaulis sp. D1M11 TaxID=3076117 RepID=UPI0039B4AA6E